VVLKIAGKDSFSAEGCRVVLAFGVSALGNSECSGLGASLVNITTFPTFCITGEVSLLHF